MISPPDPQTIANLNPLESLVTGDEPDSKSERQISQPILCENDSCDYKETVNVIVNERSVAAEV